MEIIIQGRHLNITEAIKDYVKKKALKFDKYSNKIRKIQFTLKVEGQNNIVESVCSIAKSTIVAEAINADMYAAIDLVVDKLEKQFVRQKEKLKHHKRKKEGEAIE
ncbi:MAG: ribosome hibernation-promoting factor, HPF/YfiA family [Candidatus Scalinduaceae bacterium]